jgi:hypothetical protein
LNASAGHEDGPGSRPEPEEPQEADAAAPWLAALTLHIALAVAAFGLLPPAVEAPPSSEPEALVVTLIVAEPPPPEADVEPSPEAAPAEQASPQRRFDFAPRPSVPETAPPAIGPEVLTSPDAATSAPPLPDRVRAALAQLQSCASAGADGGEREAACASRSFQIARAGLEGDSRFAPTAPALTGAAAVWTRTTSYIAASVVDASIFDGRGGSAPVIESNWASYAKANPLAGDSRIFDAMTGEVAITQSTTAP